MADDVKPTIPTGGVAGAAEKTITGGAGGAFSANNTAEQFLIWGVLQQILGAALQPAITAITDSLNEAEPIAPLGAEQAAVALVREIMDAGAASSEAALSGINGNRFAVMTQLAQQPPGLNLILQAFQRSLGQVGPGMDVGVDVDKALADLGIGEQYRPLVKAAGYVQPSAAEVLNAWLEGQISAEEATSRILATGLDPTWIQTAYNANGQAPTPTQALELWNRGIIAESGTGPDATSYEQAFLEGPWRNKWLTAFKALRFYLPPPRTVTALLKEGSITAAQATQYLKSQGLDDTLIAIYIGAASHTTTAAQRELSQAQVVDAYEARLLTPAEATADLVALKFSPSDAALLLALADKKAATGAVKSAVTKIQTLYLAGTDSAATATAALHTLGLTDDNVSALLATWNLEKATVTRTLTEGQIVAAVYYGAMSVTTATTRLEHLGYSSTDAQILIINRTHRLPDGWAVL